MIRKELKYPSFSAAESVFQKMGIEASTRFCKDDQDFEYTSCRVEEIDGYLQLYKNESTTDQEKRVLGCFLFECLNEYVQTKVEVSEAFTEAMSLIHSDNHIHETELEYWTSTEEKEENRWPITQYILQWRGN